MGLPGANLDFVGPMQVPTPGAKPKEKNKTELYLYAQSLSLEATIVLLLHLPKERVGDRKS